MGWVRALELELLRVLPSLRFTLSPLFGHEPLRAGAPLLARQNKNLDFCAD